MGGSGLTRAVALLNRKKFFGSFFQKRTAFFLPSQPKRVGRLLATHPPQGIEKSN
jgi:hypothetical protein